MSTKQYLIDSINAETAKASNLKLEDYVKAAQEGFAADRDAEKGVINSTHDASKAYVQAVNDKAVTDTKADYDSQYERNAVQKLINEKQVAEKMANLGLTDSGLNRTQQTAVQLSYANQKGKLDLARQSALDDLALNLTSALTEIETNRSADLLAADQKWNDKGYSVGQTNYNNDLSAINDRITSAYEQYGDIAQAEIDAAVQKAAIDAAVQKAAIEAAAQKAAIEAAKTPKVSYGAGGTSTGGYIVSSKTGTLSRDYKGSLKDNGVSTVYNYNDDGSIKSVTYTDSNSGISASFDAGVNPYTGKMSPDVRNKDGYYDPSKAFNNGYQPNNIKGKKLEATTATWTVYDREQKVFSIKSDKGNKYYVWRGDKNAYQELTSEEAASVGLY